MSRSNRGAALVRKLGALIVLAAIGYVAALTLPVVMTTFQFSQAMDTEVMQGPMNEPASVVHRRLVAVADRLGLEMEPEQIVVTKSGPRYEIDADYVVPIDLFSGVSYEWRFRPHKEGIRRPGAFRD